VSITVPRTIEQGHPEIVSCGHNVFRNPTRNDKVITQTRTILFNTHTEMHYNFTGSAHIVANVGAGEAQLPAVARLSLSLSLFGTTSKLTSRPTNFLQGVHPPEMRRPSHECQQSHLPCAEVRKLRGATEPTLHNPLTHPHRNIIAWTLHKHGNNFTLIPLKLIISQRPELLIINC